jgi:amino acid permease
LLYLVKNLTITRVIGPAGLLVAYAIIGFVVFWVAVELGEVAAYIPVSTT